MRHLLILCSALIVLHACAQGEVNQNSETSPTHSLNQNEREIIHPDGKRLNERISIPVDIVRTEVAANSFASYLRNLPLKAHGSHVLTFDGREKNTPDVYCAVVDLAIGKRDLHQCADAVMRLRAEYLFQEKRYDEIHFNFTNGFRADYAKWRKGQRIAVNGNQVSWTSGGQAGDSYSSFWAYLEKVFTYAGTLSLSKELKPVAVNKLEIGDVFIQGGSPGHAVIVVDLAEDSNTGKKYFLLAQSYMPAQEIQILKNPTNSTISPWYDAEFGPELYTPEWTFKASDLKRFE